MIDEKYQKIQLKKGTNKGKKKCENFMGKKLNRICVDCILMKYLGGKRSLMLTAAKLKIIFQVEARD